MSNIENKYLKYKIKYLKLKNKLKNQIGGEIDYELINLYLPKLDLDELSENNLTKISDLLKIPKNIEIIVKYKNEIYKKKDISRLYIDTKFIEFLCSDNLPIIEKYLPELLQNIYMKTDSLNVISDLLKIPKKIEIIIKYKNKIYKTIDYYGNIDIEFIEFLCSDNLSIIEKYLPELLSTDFNTSNSLLDMISELLKIPKNIEIIIKYKNEIYKRKDFDNINTEFIKFLCSDNLPIIEEYLPNLLQNVYIDIRILNVISDLLKIPKNIEIIIKYKNKIYNRKGLYNNNIDIKFVEFLCSDNLPIIEEYLPDLLEIFNVDIRILNVISNLLKIPKNICIIKKYKNEINKRNNFGNIDTEFIEFLCSNNLPIIKEYFPDLLQNINVKIDSLYIISDLLKIPKNIDIIIKYKNEINKKRDIYDNNNIDIKFIKFLCSDNLPFIEENIPELLQNINMNSELLYNISYLLKIPKNICIINKYKNEILLYINLINFDLDLGTDFINFLCSDHLPIIEEYLPKLLANLNINIESLYIISKLLKISKNIIIITKYKKEIYNNNNPSSFINFLCSDNLPFIEKYFPKLLQNINLNDYILSNISELLKIPINIDLLKNLYDKTYFEKFYINSNKSIYNVKSFIINEKLKQKWLCSQCSNVAKILGKFILGITRHVSYSEFQDKLLMSIHKIPIGQDQRYVIIVPHSRSNNKSNIWVTSILIDQINKLHLDIKIIDILYKDDEDEDDSLLYSKIILYSLFNNINFIICDDGSYSGSQLQHDINKSIIMHCIPKFKNKIYCLVPFLSNNAKQLLLKIDNVILLESDIIETVEERCKLLNITNLIIDDKTNLSISLDPDIDKLEKLLSKYFPNLRKKYRHYTLKTGSMPFYFDHKIADYVSSFPVIYQLGYIKPEGTCNNKNVLLFDNCDAIPTLESLTGKDYEGQCLIPFYKQLEIEIVQNIRL